MHEARLQIIFNDLADPLFSFFPARIYTTTVTTGDTLGESLWRTFHGSPPGFSLNASRRISFCCGLVLKRGNYPVIQLEDDVSGFFFFFLLASSYIVT